MDAAWQAIAKAGPPRALPWHLGFLWLTLALVAVLLIGALVIAWLERWRRRSGSERLSANEQLAEFRELHDRGQLSQEEFERIRALLSTELRRELDVPMAPPGTAAGQTPETPKPTEPGNPPA
jgi:type VI protein secretion system component VasK